MCCQELPRKRRPVFNVFQPCLVVKVKPSHTLQSWTFGERDAVHCCTASVHRGSLCLFRLQSLTSARIFCILQSPVVVLEVTVIEAKNLEAKDADGKHDGGKCSRSSLGNLHLTACCLGR